MTSQDFYKQLKLDFPYELTGSQDILLKKIADYILNSPQDIFVLKGYAGTGKTTIISTLVKNLPKIKRKSVLLAPTGRASKVMSTYTGTAAFTLHKHLYYPSTDDTGKPNFTLRKNKLKNTVFIVDESSMISGQNTSQDFFKEASLLSDLINYVYSQPGNQLILIGDKAQLPPVGTSLSPALDEKYLTTNFDKNIQSFELTEIVRQTLDSGILFNATKIRNEILSTTPGILKFDTTGFKDIIRLIDGYDIQDAIETAYYGNNFEETAIIVRSNKRANLYNQQIRSKVLLRENELDTGDYLMVVKNNYFWLDKSSPAGFIANGDIIEILEIYKLIDLYGFRFAEVKIRMLDYPRQKPFETVLLLDTLNTETPSLSYQENNKLYQTIKEDFSHLSKWQQYKKIKTNPYFNALQVKYAYALTGHKSQGGQWNNVFIEQPYNLNTTDKEQLRWLYTAFTRAKKKLYLIGFKDDLFQ